MNNKVRVILWGGSYNSLCKGLKWINEGNVEIVAIADRDQSKKLIGHGLGELYITPDMLTGIEYDYIVVCTSYAKAVIQQLEQMGIDNKRIITISTNFDLMDIILRDYNNMQTIVDVYNKIFKWNFIGIESYSLQWMVNKSHILHRYLDKINDCFNFSGVKIPYEAYVSYPSAMLLETYDIFVDHIEECRFSETNEGPYEFDQVQLEEGDTVIDCGANIGLFSTFAAYRTKGGQVYSFEPIPDMLKILNKAKAFYPSISIEEYAVTNKSGSSYFVVDEQNAGASHLVNDQKDKNVITVQNITLDEFVQINKIEKVDFIKADIEGEEPNMLLGASQILKEHAPKLAICTYHNPNHPLMIEDIIKRANPNYIVEHRWKKLFAYVEK